MTPTDRSTANEERTEDQSAPELAGADAESVSPVPVTDDVTKPPGHISGDGIEITVTDQCRALANALNRRTPTLRLTRGQVAHIEHMAKERRHLRGN